MLAITYLHKGLHEAFTWLWREDDTSMTQLWSPVLLAHGAARTDISYYRFIFSCQTSLYMFTLRFSNKLGAKDQANRRVGETAHLLDLFFRGVLCAVSIDSFSWSRINAHFFVRRSFSSLLLFIYFLRSSFRDPLMGHQPHRLQSGPGTQAVCLQTLGSLLRRRQR